MGERSPDLEPDDDAPPPEREPRRVAGWLALVALAAALLALALWMAPAASGVAAPRAAMVATDAGPVPRALAAVLPARLAPLLGAVALVLAALVVAWRLRPTLGERSPLWVALCVGGSIAPLLALRADGAALAASLVALGVACALPTVSTTSRVAAQVYEPEVHVGGNLALRLAAAGALIGLAAALQPLAFWALLVPAAVAPAGRRGKSVMVLAACALAAVAAAHLAAVVG